MLLRRLWPLLLIASSPIMCLAAVDAGTARTSSSQLTLPDYERQVWTSAVRDSVFASVPHTSARQGCEVTRPPEAIATPNPLLDTPDLNARISVSFIIGIDGRVHSPLILESAGTTPDRKVLSAVRSWRYHPALCNGVPTEAEGKIEFSIR